jgi:hypothetical protein
MTPDDWFALLTDHVGETSAPGAGEIEALLDLARVAAHTSERWTAPVSGFMVGLALGHLPPEARAERVRALADALEADDATTS